MYVDRLGWLFPVRIHAVLSKPAPGLLALPVQRRQAMDWLRKAVRPPTAEIRTARRDRVVPCKNLAATSATATLRSQLRGSEGTTR